MFKTNLQENLITFNIVAISVVLVTMIIEDLKTFKVSNIKQVILLLLAIKYITLYNVLLAICLSILFILLDKKYPKSLGGADIKLLLTLTLIFGYNILYILIISCGLGIITCIVTKKNKIPHIHNIVIASLVLVVCTI